MLQQVPTEIVTDPRRYLTLVYGIAGVGKTEFGAQIPGHYFFCTEAGIEGVRVFGDPILNWKDFLDKCDEVTTAKRNGWKDNEGKPIREILTIVVDTYENLYKHAGVWICKNTTFPQKGVQQKYARIEDVPYGKGYTRTNELLIEKLNKLMLSGFGVLVISHSKEKPITWRGENFQAYGPKLPPSAADGIIDACGAVSFFNTEETTDKNDVGIVMKVEEGRYMYWQNSFLIRAKHRLPGFPAKLPLPCGKGYQTYLDAFEKTLRSKVSGEDSSGNTEVGRTEEE